jgi:hypothetical protein
VQTSHSSSVMVSRFTVNQVECPYNQSDAIY